MGVREDLQFPAPVPPGTEGVACIHKSVHVDASGHKNRYDARDHNLCKEERCRQHALQVSRAGTLNTIDPYVFQHSDHNSYEREQAYGILHIFFFPVPAWHRQTGVHCECGA